MLIYGVERLHPWVADVLDIFRYTAVIDTMRRYPRLLRVCLAIAPSSIRKVKEKVGSYSKEQMKQ